MMRTGHCSLLQSAQPVEEARDLVGVVGEVLGSHCRRQQQPVFYLLLSLLFELWETYGDPSPLRIK